MKNTNFKPQITFDYKDSLKKMYGRLLRNIDDEDGVRCETYNIIMYELYKECNYESYNEIKYRITDGEDVNEVFYHIIQKGDYSSGLIWLMKQRIESYIEEDIYKRFY
jgi:hypothetical protein